MAKERHAAGKAVIARNRPGLRVAENLVAWVWNEWMAGRPTPCTAALDTALEDWRTLPPGGTVTLTWPGRPGRPPGRARRR